MSDTEGIEHVIHTPSYNVGNTYCSVCGKWLYAGRPKEDHVAVADLLSIAGQLAEAARHLLEHTEHKGDACKLLAVGQTSNALAAWDAAMKGRK